MDNQNGKSVPATANTYADQGSFEMVQRMAKALSESDLVPKAYQKNIPNTMIALEMANRIGASPIMVMQNLNVIQGKPSWSSTFIIAVINSCGKFSEQLRFEVHKSKEPKVVTLEWWKKDFKSGDSKKVTMQWTYYPTSCVAFTTDKITGERVESPAVTIETALQENWVAKEGSKWITMPDLMIRYRAAAFFGRLYCPELLMGMQSEYEVIDVDSGADEEIMTHGQWSYIQGLLQSTTLPMERTEPLMKEIEGKVTVARAKEIIDLLLSNQVPSMKDKIAQNIESDESDFDFFYSQMVRYETRGELDGYENSLTEVVVKNPHFQNALTQRKREVSISKPVATVEGV